MDPYERRSGCTCAERALRHHRLAGANARCERLATSCQPLSPTILGHPCKKRPHQCAFTRESGSRLRTGSTRSGEGLRPAVAVQSNTTIAPGAAVAPTPSMCGSRAIRPSARKTHFAPTRLPKHVWYTPCAHRRRGANLADARRPLAPNAVGGRLLTYRDRNIQPSNSHPTRPNAVASVESLGCFRPVPTHADLPFRSHNARASHLWLRPPRVHGRRIGSGRGRKSHFSNEDLIQVSRASMAH